MVRLRAGAWLADYRRDTMKANQDDPPIDLDFDPVEELSGEELVEQQKTLIEILYDGYDPHIHDWHEDVHERQEDVWQEIRDRADTEQPECPECGERHWAQSPGDPVYCRPCGYTGREEDEIAVHEAWDAMREEVQES